MHTDSDASELTNQKIRQFNPGICGFLSLPMRSMLKKVSYSCMHSNNLSINSTTANSMLSRKRIL